MSVPIPSSTCLVNGNIINTSGTSGINVSASSTITIALASNAGVNSWSISATSADDLTFSNGNLAAVNNSKVVSGFSATFTAPPIVSGRGAALQFTSTVNAGTATQSTTTIGVWVLGTSGARLFFGGETNESNATVGNAADLNNIFSTSTFLPTGNASQDGYALSWVNASNQYLLKPVATSNSNWTTLLDVDFTAATTANLATGGDGNKTIAGTTMQIFGTGVCSSFTVTNGTGIQWITTAGNTTATSGIHCNFSDALPAAYSNYNGGLEYELSYQVVLPESSLTIANEIAYTAFSENPVAERILAGYIVSTGTKNYFRFIEPPASTPLTGVITAAANTSDDCWIHRIKSGTIAEVYSGVYSSGWPLGSNYRGHHITGNPSTASPISGQWVTYPNGTQFNCAYVGGTSPTPSRTFTVKRLRIRVKSL